MFAALGVWAIYGWGSLSAGVAFATLIADVLETLPKAGKPIGTYCLI